MEELSEVYPNALALLRIIMAAPTTASTEMSFPNLKLIKTYLRITMAKECISALTSF
jgi:hypothetical protein